MSSEALTSLALQTLACTQKELAERLGVSSTQISKWKKGEHMSHGMETKLRELAGIGDRHPEFVFWAGSVDDASKWEALLRHLALLAYEGAETGYNTPLLQEGEEGELLCWHTFHVLRDMGVEIPQPFPPELDLDYGDLHDDDIEGSCERGEAFDANPWVDLISQLYRSYTDVYGFHMAYVYELLDELELYDSPFCDIEPCLLELAATKLEAPPMAKKFGPFRHQVQRNYSESLSALKTKAFQSGLPLKAELLDLAYQSHDALGHDAEAENFGFHERRLHPDIYMNELLEGMRVIHQVLPVIMKKLGIYEEFKLDEADLSLHPSS